MTAAQIIESAYRRQPELQLAVSQDGAAIGAWDATAGRYVMVAGRLIFTGPNGEEHWISCPSEVWINGKPPVDSWVPAENIWREQANATP